MADHLEQGIAAFEAGETGAAFLLFRQAIQEDPSRPAAWYWLSRVVDSPERQRESLARALQLDPDYQPAAAALAALEAADTGEAPPGEVLAENEIDHTPPAGPTFERAPEPPAGLAESREAGHPPASDQPPPIQEAPIWPYPRESVIAASPPPESDTGLSHQERIEALASLEPSGLAEKTAKPKGRRRIWVWFLVLLLALLIVVAGLAVVTYSRLPSYESLIPLLATLTPQASNRGFAAPTRDTAAETPAGNPTDTPDIPVFKAEEWLLEPVSYLKKDLGDGQIELVVDLALANYSRFLGAVTIAQRGVLTDSEGREYPIDLGFEPRLLILPGVRLHSVDRDHVLRLVAQVPGDSEDHFLSLPFSASLLNLDNGLSASGESAFSIDTQQVVPDPPTMFVKGGWESYLADAPAGVYAVEPGKPADFLSGQIILEALSAPAGDPQTPPDPFMEASIWNTNSEVTLTLRTRFPTFLQLYRDGSWGAIIPDAGSVESLTAGPGQTASKQVWSTAAGELPQRESETWCAFGLYEIISGENRFNRGVVTCYPVAPPASP